MYLIKLTMKYFSSISCLLLVLAIQTGLTSCNSSSGTTTLPGGWDKKGDFEGIPRSGAVSFVINGFAYVGTGYNSEGNIKLNDFWKYDPISDSWTQAADFIGTPRSQAVAFTINGKGYVGTGLDLAANPLSDFYEFDPSAGAKGKWKQIKSFGYTADQQDTTVSARYGSIGFTVGDRGFAGGGHYLSSLKDLWEYLPATDVWVKRPSIGGSKRENAFVMVIDDIAYVGGGTDNLQTVTDFYKFDVTNIDANPWTPLNGLTGKDINGNSIVQPRPRENASTFAINGFGYLTCGSNGNGDTWQYNPTNDTWLQYFSFTTNVPVAGASRISAVGFGIGNYGYVATGNSGNRRLDDCWRFDPTIVEPDNK